MKSYKLGFADGSISDYDWQGMLPCLEGVETLLEFGGGYSTLLFRQHDLKVTTMETSLVWKDKIIREDPPALVVLWDNFQLPNAIAGERYDLVFVDGKEPRGRQVYYASRISNRILVHDGGRAGEAQIIKDQLSSWKEIPIQGRCRYFIRGQDLGATPVEMEKIEKCRKEIIKNIPSIMKKEYTTKITSKNKYAAITSCTDNYKQYLNGLLNSMDARGLVIDFHVVVIDVNTDYLKKIESTDWSFNLILHRTSQDKVHKEVGSCKRYDSQHIRYRIDSTLFSKKSRYSTLREIYEGYDVLMMLDADMLFVGDVTSFFKMVNGTDVILGVNERFKWPLRNFDPMDGEDWPQDVIMNWMICNAPTWFSPAHHPKLVHEVDYCARNLRQKGSVVSDLFSMNVALWRAGASDKVVQLPFHCWTGCHNGYIQMYTQSPED